MTIGDSIRAMTDDEIADFIEKARRNVGKYYDYLEHQICFQCEHYTKDKYKCGITPKSICEEDEFERKCPCISDFKGCVKKWLQSEEKIRS